MLVTQDTQEMVPIVAILMNALRIETTVTQMLPAQIQMVPSLVPATQDTLGMVHIVQI